MQKVIKADSTVIVIFDDGTTVERSNVSNDLFNQVVKAKDDSEVKCLMIPDYSEKVSKYNDAIRLISKVENSKYISEYNNTFYWKEISNLSVPIELVNSVIDAEENNDKKRLEAYRNFWTLMSLNPSEECRLNLFWFLNRNGLVISRSGFFVAYRNVNPTNEEGVYTDAHTGTFKIRIGEMVTMPRRECDCNSDVTCSQGLHLGARTWLKKNYYGIIGLVCLCNPAEVVAVPKLDYYGKLRTCAYLPIDFAKFDENGDVIQYDAKDGFECKYVPGVIYEGLMGTEKDSNYRITIPDIPELNKEVISTRLLDLARECITNKEL